MCPSLRNDSKILVDKLYFRASRAQLVQFVSRERREVARETRTKQRFRLRNRTTAKRTVVPAAGGGA